MSKWFGLNKPLTWVLVAVLVMGIGAFCWHLRGGNSPVFRTAAVKRGDVSATISATGTLEPVEVVDVGAQVAGQIISFGTDTEGKRIDYRSVVDEGAVLAKIDESVYAADLAVANAQLDQDKAGELSASANLDQSKAKFTQTEAEWRRMEELTRSKLVAASDSDIARANYEVAKANVSVAEAAVAQARASSVQAKAAVEKAQRNLGFCTIKSPVKGVIIDRRVNIGQTVVASLNTPSLFLIAKDLTKMQIWAGVNEADVGRITSGAPVTFLCDAFPGKKFNGSVGKVRLNATMTQNVVMYTVEVNTENPDNILLPYLTANVKFIVQSEKDALLVPNAALRWSPSSNDEVAPDARASKTAASAGDSGGESKASSREKKSNERHVTLWIKDGEFVRPIEVVAGVSDGVNTTVSGEALKEGQEVVTGETLANSEATTKNPFIPQMPRR